jgi:hypothetical protein
MREMMEHAIVAGCVAPKISFKDEPGTILVSKIFTDFILLPNYYEKIVMPKNLGLIIEVKLKNEA